MKPWIKAGIAGGILQVMFTLPSFLAFYVPLGIGGTLSLFTCCAFLLLYPLPGVLDVHWTSAARTEGKLALAGALAGLLATGIASMATLLLVLLVSVSGAFDRYMEDIMPGAMELISQAGLDFMYSTAGLMAQTGFALIFHVISGVALSALGGIVYAGVRNKNK